MFELNLNELNDIYNALTTNNNVKESPIDITELQDIVSNHIDLDYLNNEIYLVFPVMMMTTCLLGALSYLYLQVS
jgi:hypothetical protein